MSSPLTSTAAIPASSSFNSSTAVATSTTSSAASRASQQFSDDKILHELMRKIVHIVVRARIPASSELTKTSPLNKWFNFHIPVWAGVRGELDIMLSDHTNMAASTSASAGASQLLTPGIPASLSFGNSPQPQSQPTSALTSSPHSSLQLDIILRNSRNYEQYILLERWNMAHERVHEGDNPALVAATRKTNTSEMYKKLLILVRSIYTYTKFVPAYHAWRYAQLKSETRESCAYVLTHQLSSNEKPMNYLIQQGLVNSAYGNTIPAPVFDQSPHQQTFSSVPTPLGRVLMNVSYRTSLDIDFLVAAGVVLNSIPRTFPHSHSSHSHNNSLTSPLNPHQIGSSSAAAVENQAMQATSMGMNGTIITDYMAQPSESSSHSNQPQQPRSALSWGLEMQKQKRENSGGTNANDAQPQQQQPPFNTDRRHTLPPNQLQYASDANQQQQYSQQQQQQQQQPQQHPPRTDRAQSMFGGSQQPQQRHHSRVDSDSDPFVPATSSNASKPMSIPRNSGSIGAGNQGGGAAAPSSAPGAHHPSSQNTQFHSHSHSPSSDPPSFNNSFTPPVGSQPQVGSYGAPTTTAYSPFSGPSHVPTSLPSSSSNPHSHPHGMPYSHSGSNLEKLLEEDDRMTEEERFGQDANGGLYDTGHGTAGHQQQRLPHSQSQPMHLNPATVGTSSPQHHHRSSLTGSSSGSLPVAIPPSSSVGPHVRRGSIGIGSPTDGANNSFGKKPPLPSPGSYNSSSRATTSFNAPAASALPQMQLQPTMVIREREPSASPYASPSPFVSSPATSSRFSGTNAASAFPPPILGTSTPSPHQSTSGLGQALAQAQQQNFSPVGSMFGSPNLKPQQSNISPQQKSSSTNSPNSPSLVPLPSTTTSRAIPIPMKTAPAGLGGVSGTPVGGSLFGRTPPFATSQSGASVGSFNASSVTALGILKGATSVSPSPPVSAVWPVTAVGVTEGSTPGSATPIQLSVAPFKQRDRDSRQRSMSSVGSPALLPAQPTKIHLTPQVTGFDLSGAARQGSDSVANTQNHSTSASVSGGGGSTIGGSLSHASATLPFGTMSPVASGDDQDGDNADASLGKFLSFLNHQQSHQPSVGLFMNAPPSSLSVQSSSPASSTLGVAALRQSTLVSVDEALTQSTMMNRSPQLQHQQPPHQQNQTHPLPHSHVNTYSRTQ